MATITFSIESTPVTGSKVYTISDADVTRWLAAAKAWYGPNPDGSTPTNAQVLVKWTDAVIAEMKRQVVDRELKATVIPPVVTT